MVGGGPIGAPPSESVIMHEEKEIKLDLDNQDNYNTLIGHFKKRSTWKQTAE